MTVDEMFVGSRDTETHRVCGTCGELKAVTEFYKDGTDSNSKARYRRDCKYCYKTTRMHEKRMKERGKKK